MITNLQSNFIYNMHKIPDVNVKFKKIKGL